MSSEYKPKQVKLLKNVNDMLEAIVKARSPNQASVNKQSVVNDLIMTAYKKECK